MANEIIFYRTPDGEQRIEVVFRDEDFWMTQKALAELFGGIREIRANGRRFRLFAEWCGLSGALLLSDKVGLFLTKRASPK